MSEEKKEVSSGNSVSEIKSIDINNIDKTSQQFVKKEIIPKNEEEKQNNIINEVPVQEVPLEIKDLQEKIIGGKTLPAKYLLENVSENKLEKRLFNIIVPECKFKKYLRYRNINGNDHIMGVSELSPLFAKTIDDLKLGVTCALSTTQELSSQLFFKPGVTNLVLVKEMMVQGGQAIALNPYMYTARPYRYGMQITDDQARLAAAEFALRDLQPNVTVYNPQNYHDVHHGPSHYNGGGFVYKIGLQMLHNTELSYETGITSLYKQLNVDPQMPNTLLEPMRRVQLRTGNIQLRDVITWVYNTAPTDNLCYSPLVEQFKLALYTDAFTTHWDMVEGLSQMGQVPRDKFFYNSAGNFYPTENVSNVPIHQSVLPIWVVGCSWDQYLEYVNGRDPGHDQNYDLRANWQAIPIKRDWLRDHEAMFSLILSLAPYPIGCNVIPLVWPDTMQVVAGNNNMNLNINQGYAEHTSSRIRIEGYNRILLVLIDSLNTDIINPVAAGYDDLWNLNNHGVNYRILNLFNLPPPGQNLDMHNILFRWLSAVVPAMQDYPLLLLQNWARIIKWNIYADIFNLVAYFSCRNGIHYRGVETSAGRLNTESLCSLLPPVEQFPYKSGSHIDIGSPSFVQRVYAILGMVKQKGSDFIMSLSSLEFREMMMGKRYAVAAIKSHLLENKRNQVRVQFPAHDQNDFDAELENRRKQFIILYNKNIEMLDELSVDTGYYNRVGFVSYIKSRAQVGTFQTAWSAAWTDINEYGGLEDWANFMSTTIIGDKYRCPRVDEIDGLRVEAVNGRFSFWIDKWDGKHSDLWLKMLNSAFGRTFIAPGVEVADNYIYLWYANADRRIGHLEWEFYQPYWAVGYNTWIGDLDPGLALVATFMYTNITFNNGNRDAIPNPFIRVLDYNIPYLKIWDKYHTILLTSSRLFNNPQPYINITTSNKLLITNNDYINRQGYEELHE